LLDRDRRIAPALVRRGANELDQCSHRINPPGISLLVMSNPTGRDCLTSRFSKIAAEFSRIFGAAKIYDP
jgi:hypothetical protein